MEYTVNSYTIKSKFHTNNEDNHIICDDYIIVADGMGGESDGDIASRIAVESIDSVLSQNLLDNYSDTYIKELSTKAIYDTDILISEYIDKHPDSFGMGTTVLLAIRKGDKIYISWCGDSHCYVYNNGNISSLTKDHSYVQQLIDAGRISVEEAFIHPDSNLITRFVGGGNETCKPDFCVHQISDTEIIIFCSDGLSGYCMQNDIAKEIEHIKVIDELPKRLSDLAIRHGSDDDITIVTIIPKSYIHLNTSDNTSSKFGWLKRLIHCMH